MVLVFTSSEKQGKLYQVQILTQECAYVCRVFSLSGSRYHFYSSHNSWWITPGLSVPVPLEFRHSEELGKLLVYAKVTRKFDNAQKPWIGDFLSKLSWLFTKRNFKSAKLLADYDIIMNYDKSFVTNKLLGI